MAKSNATMAKKNVTHSNISGWLLINAFKRIQQCQNEWLGHLSIGIGEDSLPNQLIIFNPN